MRWFVEVAPSSRPEAAEKWVVEAAQWQPALQAARTLRGETVEMSGFSIELLEDGFRAVDPATFIKYIVRRAPDGTPISNPRSRAPQAHKQNGGSVAPTSGSPAPTDATAASRAARIAAALDIGGTRSSASPGASAPPPATSPSVPPAPEAPQVQRASQPPRPWSQSGPPRPGAPRGSQPPPATSWRASAPDLAGAARKSAPDLASAARRSAPDLANAARKSAPDLANASRASSPDSLLPPAELLFQREEDPSPSSPLTYRETVWVVPAGTSSDAAVRLLVGMFEGVRAALAGAKPGKLVNMAIFDHRFQGKPQAPPLATLTWKDWKDQGQGPDIRRQGDPPVSMRPSALPPELAAPQNTGAPAPQVSPSIPPPPMVPAPPAPLAHPNGLAAASVVPVAAAPMVPAPPVVASAPPAPVAAPVASAPPAAPVPDLAASFPPPVAIAPVMTAPAPIAPAPVVPPSAPAFTPTFAGPEQISSRTPSVPRIRLSGVELITDLFEAMHDLHFLRDSLEGADFVLALVMEKLPSMVGLVHFYDIDAREFVVVRTVGPGAAKALQIRTNEKEALIAEAMRSRRAVVIDDATTDSRAQSGRWALIGSCRSLVVAPVEQGGRFLGLLELANPKDGGPFHESDGHALTYMGEQFAEFLATRGLILDPDRIGR